MELLEQGVLARDATIGEMFVLRGCLALMSADQQAMRKLILMRGAGAKSGCRLCKIQGVHLQGRGPYYYIHCSQNDFNPRDVAEPDFFPLDEPYNFIQKPLRRNTKALIMEVARANSEVERKRTGISGASILIERPTLYFNRSFPYDSVHFVLQNIVPQLILIWHGETFQDHDEHDEFLLGPQIWQEIGRILN